MWHKRMLTVVLLIIFIAGLGSFGMRSVSAAAPTTPIPLTPQGYVYLCDSVLHNVNFRWTSVAGATYYTIQLSSVFDFSTVLVNYTSPATEFYLSGINLLPGIYYWRVLAGNSDGSSLWAIKSFEVIPTPPVLVSPPNNGFNLPNTTFTWTTCYPFETELQLSTNPDFAYVFLDVNFNANQGIWKNGIYEYRFFYPLNCGMYWWRVRTKLGTEMSPWVTQPFMIIIPPNIAPTLIAPQDNSTIASKNIVLKWSYVDNADRYRVQISRENTSLIDTVVFTTSYNFIGDDNTIYYFRVRGENPVGWGPWSEWRQFKILLPPNTPTLASPFNGRIIQNSNIVALTWNPITTADSYLIQIVNINTGIAQTFEVLAPNINLNFVGQWGNNYTWRVKAKNVSGESSWSNSWVFTIQENIPPKIDINSYPQYTNQNNIIISGKVYDLESGLEALYLGPNSVPVSSDGTFKINFNLNEGLNSFTLVAIDKAGNKTQQTIGIVKDTIPPEINITFPIVPIYPSYEGITVIADIKVTGTIKDSLSVKLVINNENCPVDSYGNFEYQTNLNYGLNKVYIKAIDAAGNSTEKTLLIYKTITPKFIFKINNPKMQVQVINKQGQLEWVEEEIDPGRYTVPVIVKGRVFIPVRKFIELVNGTVEWDAISKKVTITVPARGKTIELWIDKPVARITDSYGNQQWIQIEKGDNSVAPFIKNGRSYFPLRFIAEELNAIVNWDQVLQQVTIEFPLVP